MINLTPNSYGAPDRLEEFNSCHSPADGTFCSAGGAMSMQRFTRRGRGAMGRRARAVQGKVTTALQQPGLPIARQQALMRRYNVAQPIARRTARTSFLGTLLRRGRWQGPSVYK